MGIRTPPETDYRREWLALKTGARIAVQVNVTKPNGDPITNIALFARIIAQAKKSAIINSLGTVYVLDVLDARGNEDDIFAFPPRRIGRRKIRYWLCVYDDLFDTKIIATSESVTHDELVRNLKTSDGSLRLAEYAVSDVRLTDENGTVVPFPGDEDPGKDEAGDEGRERRPRRKETDEIDGSVETQTHQDLERGEESAPVAEGQNARGAEIGNGVMG